MSDFVFNVLIYCIMLLGNNFGKEKIYKIIFEFIVYFDSN